MVLSHLRQWRSTNDLSLEKFSHKLVVLLALTTAQRVQTLSLINTQNIIRKHDRFEIQIPDRIKTSGVGRVQPTLILPFYKHEETLCPVSTLTYYLEQTANLRGSEKKLFVSFKKPHKAVTTQTLSRWIKNVLGSSGIDISCFSAHSTRHASTSAANRDGVSIDVILRTAGWTQKSNTFAQFYRRNVVGDSSSFALSILNSSHG